jgi:hypothetical protein
MDGHPAGLSKLAVDLAVISPSSLTTAPPVMLGCLAAEAVPLTSDQRYHIFVPQRDVGNLADVLRRVHDTVSLGCFEAET